ncbi:MAG: sulfatase-like hydrolase/transferase [Planctomycetota bacterium]|nr:sulfatase-like hydrolase/transferase [Planctomycetota bacterium]MDA1214098.1 sulfatase-like hydrolase/transferase [Planctomycetota bacterium]
MKANVIVLSFDVMPLSLLGCYGNEWALTPHFDQLAWEGVTFDQHFTTDATPERRQLAWWTGNSSEPELGEFPDAQAKFLFRVLHDIPCVLHVEPATRPVSRTKKGVKKSITKRTSPFERLLQFGLASVEELRERGSSSLLWLHYDGLAEPFDPPPEYLELYLDELEDLPDDQRSLDLIHAAAAVSHLDHLFGHFRRQYEEQCRGEELIWVFTAAGSCPVGFEPNGRSPAERMSEGYIHTPLIIASSNGSTKEKKSTRSVASSARSAGTRRQQLVQTIDLLPTLCELFHIEWDEPIEGQSLLPMLGDAATPSRPHLFIRDAGKMAGMRTETEFLVCRAANDQMLGEDHFGKEILLYRKPEDRWEEHDVSRMTPELTLSLLRQVPLCSH